MTSPRKPTGKESVDFTNDALNGKKEEKQVGSAIQDAEFEETRNAAAEMENKIVTTDEVFLSAEEMMMLEGSFDEAEQQQGIGISAVGLGQILKEQNNSAVFVFVRRGKVTSDLGGESKEVPAVFLQAKDRKLYFSSSAGLVGALEHVPTVEENGTLNYVRVTFLEQGKTKKGLSINRYDIRLVTPKAIQEHNRKLLGS